MAAYWISDQTTIVRLMAEGAELRADELESRGHYLLNDEPVSPESVMLLLEAGLLWRHEPPVPYRLPRDQQALLRLILPAVSISYLRRTHDGEGISFYFRRAAEARKGFHLAREAGFCASLEISNTFRLRPVRVLDVYPVAVPPLYAKVADQNGDGGTACRRKRPPA